MIRFACPNCQKSLRHAKPLAKVACPRCGPKIPRPLASASGQ
jgi:DNA-directed RNA polymerase subunit RPC12/RpoP